MRSRLPALIVGFALIAGCSSGGGASGTATVTGHFVRVGGPAPGAPVPLHGRIEFISQDRTVTVQVARDGKFMAHLLSGHYAVNGTSPEIEDGHDPCSTPSELTVTAGEKTQVRVVCDIK